MILWVRHGQSTWNVLDRMQGQIVHPPLTDLGRQQAAKAAQSLVDRDVTRILSSPATRARQTAEIIGLRLGLDVGIEPLLAERDLDESVGSVLRRIREFLDLDLPGVVVAVSHGDLIGLAVGMLAGSEPTLPANCSITSVDPRTRAVELTCVSD